MNDNRVILSRVGNPDTERLNWLEKQLLYNIHKIFSKHRKLNIREAIDKAMEDTDAKK